MSAINTVSGGTGQQWQLLQQLRASRAAETAASNGAAIASPVTDAGAAATAATSGSLQPGISQSGTGATATASAPAGIFDTVAAKLMAGMQSFLVNMQSDGGSAAPGASASGYSGRSADAGGSSLMTGLTA